MFLHFLLLWHVVTPEQVSVVNLIMCSSLSLAPDKVEKDEEMMNKWEGKTLSTNDTLEQTVLICAIYLRKVSVSNLTFITFLSSEGLAAWAAAGVHVALLAQRANHITATLLGKASAQPETVFLIELKNKTDHVQKKPQLTYRSF